MSVHEGFHLLTHILEVESVSILCLQEVLAGDFPTLLGNQPCVHDGPAGSRGSDAGFLIHEGVSCAPIRGVTDSVYVMWRVFQGKVCICSFYAPNAGFSECDRISYWRDLLVSARHTHSTMNLPMIMAGDANVWHPHFNLGRTRSVDALIIPFVDLLASSCGLRLCNPRDQATHDAGAALDLVFISSLCEAVVHNGVSVAVRFQAVALFWALTTSCALQRPS